MVTKLLSRAEMLSNPQALEAVKAEADGPIKAGTWSLDSVREKEDVRAEAKRTGVSVHFGQLMTIASIKFYELAEHLQKMKGRIVYRGDCAKDEHGAAAVYQELGANPTSVQGLNTCLAYGSLPGNSSSAADAVKAYVQALLSSKYKTWIGLLPELRPKHWRDKFVKPVVLLVKALYGHPDAGGLWEQHLKKIIRNLGGQEVPEYPGNFFFPDTKLLLSTYVDDLTLAGPTDQHEAFWAKLTSVVDIEPPEPIYRILGRNHLVMPLPKTEGSEECAAFRAQEALVFDMLDYAHQTVDLYKSITNTKSLKHAATPFVPDGSVSVEDEAKGELAPNACRILMKALWLGRLSRPDIIKSINDLATKVQSWSKGDDKRLLRLIQYTDSTPQYRLVGTMKDNPENLELSTKRYSTRISSCTSNATHPVLAEDVCMVVVRLIASWRVEFDLVSYGQLHWCVPFSTCMSFLRDQSCHKGFISLLKYFKHFHHSKQSKLNLDAEFVQTFCIHTRSQSFPMLDILGLNFLVNWRSEGVHLRSRRVGQIPSEAARLWRAHAVPSIFPRLVLLCPIFCVNKRRHKRPSTSGAEVIC